MSTETLFPYKTTESTQSPPSGMGVFNLYENLTEYHQMRDKKYADNPSIVTAPLQPTFQSYYTPMSFEQVPAAPAGQAPVMQSFAPQPILDGYIQPQSARFDATTMGFQSYEQPTVTHSPTKVKKSPFMPTIFGADLQAVDFKAQQVDHAAPAVPTAELVAEFPVDLPQAVADTEEETATQTSFSSHFKLNGVGLVAVVCFIAVTILVVAFIIANSVAIKGASGRIAALRATNSGIVTELSALQSKSAQVYEQRAADARAQVTAPNSGYFRITTETSPSAPAWVPPANEVSTNWFNEISKFLSKIF